MRPFTTSLAAALLAGCASTSPVDAHHESIEALRDD